MKLSPIALASAACAFSALCAAPAFAQAASDTTGPSASAATTSTTTTTTTTVTQPASPAADQTSSAAETPATSTTSADSAANQSSPRASAHHARLQIGVDAGVFLPTATKTRDAFGSSWVSVGLGLGAIHKAPAQGGFGLDFSIQYQKNGGNHAFFAPIGVAYVRAFNPNSVAIPHESVPYYGASVDFIPADLRSVEDNVHSGFHYTGGGSIFVGTTIGDNGYIQARYVAVATVENFDLSGLDLTAGIRF